MHPCVVTSENSIEPCTMYKIAQFRVHVYNHVIIQLRSCNYNGHYLLVHFKYTLSSPTEVLIHDQVR